MNVFGRLLLGMVVATLATSSARASSIWFDTDGDSEPDSDTLAITVGDPLTVGVWIDSDSYAWNHFLVYVAASPEIVIDSAYYSVEGGGPFSIDDYSRPNTIGFGGSGYDLSGVTKIGELSLHAEIGGGQALGSHRSRLGCLLTAFHELDILAV